MEEGKMKDEVIKDVVEVGLCEGMEKDTLNSRVKWRHIFKS